MKSLPCFPCPHNSICCSWGTAIFEDEKQQIEQEFGKDYIIWDDEEQEYRTALKDNHCIFLVDNKCLIHDKPYYPIICKGFPFKQGNNAQLPYQYEIDICPELNNSPLMDPISKKLKVVK